MSSKSKRLAIVGAGFSGLTLAWFLRKKNFEVEIFEKKERAGGLIHSENSPILVESAAPALLSNFWVEKLFEDLKLEILPAGHQARSRWIFRDRPRRWPLSLKTTTQGVLKFTLHSCLSRTRPQPDEALDQWGERHLGSDFVHALMAPALGGIYGVDISELSAPLVLGGFFDKTNKAPRGRWRGSVSPRGGMGQLMRALEQHLRASGVKFHFNTEVELRDLNFDGRILASSISGARQMLKATAPKVSDLFAEVPMSSLSSVTLGFESITDRVRGFGCLFPREAGFNSLGVLFNSDIFENRGPLVSETWISTGSSSSDREILAKISKDRKRITSDESPSRFQKIIRWEEALPVYGRKLESALRSPALGCEGDVTPFQKGARLQEIQEPTYLSGNYLGGIGLGKIICYNQRLSQRIEQELAL